MALSLASQTKTIEVSKATYGAWSETLAFSVFLNDIPEQPVKMLPANEALNQDTRPIFTWTVPFDSEENDLNFHIQVDISEDFSSQGGVPVFEALSSNSYDGFSFSAPVPSGAGQVSFQNPVPLIDRTVYYWRVRAHDGTRYGHWSSIGNFTVGILATKVVISTTQAYLPVAGMSTAVVATYQDALGNVDTNYIEPTTFVQSQTSLGTFNPVIATTVNGVASTVYTTSGILGASQIEIVSSLEHSPLVVFSVNVDNIPILVSPANGKRLESQSKPKLTWTVPNNINSRSMHFKVEIYKSSLLNLLHLVYEADSKDDTTGFSYTSAISPLSPDVSHDVQISLPDGKYWWRIVPWDGFSYLEPSKTFSFGFPDVMSVVSKPLVSVKPITQAVAMANVSIDIGNELEPAVARHYITNMALENEENIVWYEVTQNIIERKKFIFPSNTVPEHGWAIALKTVINANDSTGQISFNGHGVVFDGDYSETTNEDYVGVISSLTPIAFQALPSIDGSELALSWAYVDLNSDNRRIIDKFVVEVYNPATGLYEPYDGNKGEITA